MYIVMTISVILSEAHCLLHGNYVYCGTLYCVYFIIFYWFLQLYLSSVVKVKETGSHPDDPVLTVTEPFTGCW